MTDDRFARFIPVILQHEGGYVNDPDDPGGETKFGISKRSFPAVDIKNLTEDQAKDIYFKHFYSPLNLHLIHNDTLALHVFDHAVNAGKYKAIAILQKLLHCKKDGIIGNITASLANNDLNIVSKYKQARIKFYNQLVIKNSKLQKFIKGWINRVNSTNLR